MNFLAKLSRVYSPDKSKGTSGEALTQATTTQEKKVEFKDNIDRIFYLNERIAKIRTAKTLSEFFVAMEELDGLPYEGSDVLSLSIDELTERVGAHVTKVAEENTSPFFPIVGRISGFNDFSQVITKLIVKAVDEERGNKKALRAEEDSHSMTLDTNPIPVLNDVLTSQTSPKTHPTDEISADTISSVVTDENFNTYPQKPVIPVGKEIAQAEKPGVASEVIDDFVDLSNEALNLNPFKEQGYAALNLGSSSPFEKHGYGYGIEDAHIEDARIIEPNITNPKGPQLPPVARPTLRANTSRPESRILDAVKKVAEGESEGENETIIKTIEREFVAVETGALRAWRSFTARLKPIRLATEAKERRSPVKEAPKESSSLEQEEVVQKPAHQSLIKRGMSFVGRLVKPKQPNFQETFPPTISPEELSINENGEVVIATKLDSQLERKLGEDILRKKLEAENTSVLTAITKKTQELFNTAFASASPSQKTILENVAALGERFNSLPKKTRYGIGLTLAILGATGAGSTAPFLALATVYRAASAAGLYSVLHTALEKGYEKLEQEGKKTNVLRKNVMRAGAAVTAAVGGRELGDLIAFGSEHMHDLVNYFSPEHVSAAGNPAITTAPVARDAVTPTQPEITQTTPVQDTVTPDAIAQSSTDALQAAGAETLSSSVHVFSEGETVWSVVKEHLLSTNKDFGALSDQAKNYEISKYITYIVQEKLLPNVNIVHPGDTFDFTKVDGKVPDDILKKVSPLARLFTAQP